MKRARIGELPEIFEEIEKNEYALNQKNGHVFVTDEGRVTKHIRDLLGRFKAICGTCFGGHLADIAGTRVSTETYAKEELRDDAKLSEMAAEMLKEVDSLTASLEDIRIPFREYEDGVVRFAKAVFRGRHFTEWRLNRVDAYEKEHRSEIRLKVCRARFKKDLNSLMKSEKNYGSTSAIMSVIEDYLHNECDAPENCFGPASWEGVKPSQVLRRFIELNPETAKAAL